MRRHTRTATATFAAGLLAVGLLGGCDAAQKVTGPDASEAADTLAGALSSGDFGDVGVHGGTPDAVTQDYATLVAGMGEVTPSVAASEVVESGDTAKATLQWTWPIAGDEWTYTTTADWTLVDDEWLVDWDPAVVQGDLEDGQRLDVTPIAARRGPVVGAHGTKLVTDRPVMRFGIDRSQVPAKKAGDAARRLAALVGIDPKAYAKLVEASGDKAFVEAIVYRQGEVPRALARVDDIPGVLSVSGELPLAPTKEFAAPILGRVGPVTAEMIKDDPDTYHPGDEAGTSGLQARYDDQLRGVQGAVVERVDGQGSGTELFRVAAQAGTPLRLSLDVDLQLEAERLLADVGPASAIVALRPSTGDILAAANGPGTNGYNMATYGQFAPGSTFKSVSSLALLRAGLTPDSVVPCTPTITVDGKTFKNYSDYPATGIGRIPLRTALANSCNTAFISQAGKLGRSGLVDAAASLGLGVDHDLGFPAYFGNVEPPASETEAAADMIGQGTILASPVAMAAVIGSVQSGRLVVPRLVESVDVAPPDGVEKLTSGEGAALKSMLRGVVLNGSGRGLLDVPGPPVIAKTGTAEFESDGGKVLTHAWMIAAQGDLAVAVFVDIGESGSGTAGPILEAFLRAAR
ncbi:penicillin-binding transpeptidase domain-containing protein [Nocardioides sp. LS1]|uniref:penicillin-binding transpeptidase domain-containing protein n=1 Tax=Nocardioides sp. LS1 TaxID=1027620 RepID=UPI000F618F63|nr:penicillin-binding transpeptidase domain-containing protein [Nocardioides sp. LS1]GCD90310.1 cell division protein FtsI [Nocardioides sp. LS1]